MNKLVLIISILFLLSACSKEENVKKPLVKEKREHAFLQYLDTSTEKKTNQSLNKQYQNQFVRWTARVSYITDEMIKLELPKKKSIDAWFSYDISEEPIQKGDILTVSCYLEDGDYFWGSWVLEQCRIETTKMKEKEALLAYEANPLTEKEKKEIEKEKKEKEELEAFMKTLNDDTVGAIGYVVTDDTYDFSNFDLRFPKSPWSVPTVKKVGPKKYEETNQAVPHKTKVKIIENDTWSTGIRFDPLQGALEVQELDHPEKIYWIHPEHYTSHRYWEMDVVKATEYAPFLAVYNGKGEKPILDGEYLDVPVGTKVVVEKHSYNERKSTIEAKVYKTWELGYGGVGVEFDPISLEIVY